MSELERAYAILRLRPGASVKEIIEARDDLLYLWDPSRLSGRPSLRSKAIVQQREIQQASEFLLERLSGVQSQASETPGNGATASSGPSIYDDVFSRKPEKRFSWVGLAIVTGFLVTLLIAVLMFLNSPEPPALEEGSQEETTPLERPQEVAEERPGQSPGTESSVQESTDSTGLEAPGNAAKNAPLRDEKSEPAARIQPGESTNRPAPPAARTAQPVTRQPSAVSGKRPVLLRGASPAEDPPPTTISPANSPVSAENSSVDPPQSGPEAADKQGVFDLLLEKSLAARMLAGDRFDDLPFTGWEIRDVQNGENYLDLAVEQNGTTIHFIWGVSPESQQVRPLSQAARDLEARTRN